MDDKQLTQKINTLADLLHSRGLTKIELTEGDFSVSVEAAAQKIESRPAPAGSETPPLAKKEPESTAHSVISPAVGTVYLAGGVGQEPFVKCGSHVKKGQKLCVLESMKLFSDLCSDCEGVVESINVSNGQVVGVGDTLFRIALSGDKI